jgi:hypothetical protein
MAKLRVVMVLTVADENEGRKITEALEGEYPKTQVTAFYESQVDNSQTLIDAANVAIAEANTKIAQVAAVLDVPEVKAVVEKAIAELPAESVS